MLKITWLASRITQLKVRQVSRADTKRLIRALNHPSPEVRHEAESHLIGQAADVLIPLMAELKRAYQISDRVTSNRITGVLVSMGAPAVDALLGVVTGTLWQAPYKYSSFGQAALDCLIAIGEPAVEPLIRLLDGGMLSPVAAAALVRIGDPAVPALAARLGVPTGAENHIVSAIARINSPASRDALELASTNGTPEAKAACQRVVASPDVA